MRYVLSFALGFVVWSLACTITMVAGGTYKNMGVFTFPVFVAVFSWAVYVTRDRTQPRRVASP